MDLVFKVSKKGKVYCEFEGYLLILSKRYTIIKPSSHVSGIICTTLDQVKGELKNVLNKDQLEFLLESIINFHKGVKIWEDHECQKKIE